MPLVVVAKAAMVATAEPVGKVRLQILLITTHLMMVALAVRLAMAAPEV